MSNQSAQEFIDDIVVRQLAIALDVAQYIIKKTNKPMSKYRLQTLAYYCDAWHLVWEGEPLTFTIYHAAITGPRSRQITNYLEGRYHLPKKANIYPYTSRLTRKQKRIIKKVLASYNHLTDSQLFRLAKNEDPWVRANETVSNENQYPPISNESIYSFYSSVSKNGITIKEATKYLTKGR